MTTTPGDPPALPFAGLVDAALELAIAPSWSRAGYQARRFLYRWDDDPPARLDGQVVVLTGFTSGIGRASAHRLGGLGADLHLVGRDLDKVRDVAAELRGDGARVTTSVADLSDLDAVREVADDVTSTHGRVDVLVHNAGALTREWTASPQGIEVTVAAQVYGPFLLTHLLVPLLEAGGGGRVLTVSSGGMYAERLSVDDLEMAPEHYDGVRAYARAKRAQVELTEEWARRAPAAVAFHALHPGWADTPGVVEGLPGFHALARPVLRTPDQGADTLVWLAGAPADQLGPSGGFWLDRHRRPTTKVPWTHTPDGERERLWAWCERRVGLSF